MFTCKFYNLYTTYTQLEILTHTVSTQEQSKQNLLRCTRKTLVLILILWSVDRKRIWKRTLKYLYTHTWHIKQGQKESKKCNKNCDDTWKNSRKFLQGQT